MLKDRFLRGGGGIRVLSDRNAGGRPMVTPPLERTEVGTGSGNDSRRGAGADGLYAAYWVGCGLPVSA